MARGVALDAPFSNGEPQCVEDFFSRHEAAAWGGFLSAHASIAKRVEENLCRTAGLSHAEYEVLLRLFMQPDGRLRIQALAAESLLTHSGMSRLVGRLEGAGLVVRAEAEEDRRGAYAELTAQGSSQFRQVAAQHTAFVRELFLASLHRDRTQAAGRILESAGQHLGRSWPPVHLDEILRSADIWVEIQIR